MGCSGSTAGNAGAAGKKKFDDNKILREKGLQPLNKNELKAFNDLWNVLSGVTYKLKEGQQVQADQLNQMPEACKAVFEGDAPQKTKLDQMDADVDGKLNKEEGSAFLTEVVCKPMGASQEVSAQMCSKWLVAVAMLDTESDGFSWEDFKRSKDIVQAWFESPKGAAAAMQAIPPEARAKMVEKKEPSAAAAAADGDAGAEPEYQASPME